MKLLKHLLIIPALAVSALCASAQADSTAQAQEAPSAAPAPVRDVLPDSLAPQETTVLSADSLAAHADQAYSADDYLQAEQLYLQALKHGGSSSTLFYNLGNAYYRQGYFGKAIVCYERALKLNPTNADARQNLDFVNAKITDKQIDSGSYMESVWEGTVGMFHADTWAIIALVLFAIFLGAVTVYIFSSAVALKKASFFGGMVVFVVTVCAVLISFAAANRINDHSHAIILSPASQLSTSPREARTPAEQAFTLHEGTKVEIIDSVSTGADGQWYEVLVGHGERAWVKAADVERI